MLRRSLAAALMILAGVTAVRPTPVAHGISVLTLAHDVQAGHRLTAEDLTTRVVGTVPDGALDTPGAVEGRTMAGAGRRGEILTDLRLVPADGPDPGPGRRALTVRPIDPAAVELLSPGVHVSVVGLDIDGAATVLTADAVVLAIPEPSGAGSALRPLLVAVPDRDADRVSAATLAGDVAVQFTR